MYLFQHSMNYFLLRFIVYVHVLSNSFFSICIHLVLLYDRCWYEIRENRNRSAKESCDIGYWYLAARTTLWLSVRRCGAKAGVEHPDSLDAWTTGSPTQQQTEVPRDSP